MALDAETVELVFPPDFDARAEWEAEQRGLLDNVVAQVGPSKSYNLCFFTPDRLAVEFKLLTQSGESCLAYPGLVVVSEVTRPAMHAAVAALLKDNYFQQLTPIP